MKSNTLLILCVLLGAAVIGGFLYKKHEADERRVEAARKLAAMPKLNILFVGDSYTFVNDLPHMIARVAASDPQNPVNLQVGMLTHGNYTLEQLWNLPQRAKVMQQRPWDIVVLQEHSMETLLPEWVQTMQQYFIQWNTAISRIGAHPLVYETWARKPGSKWYTGKQGNLFISPEYMQQQVDTVTNMLAKYIRAPVVAAGDYFAYCRNLPGAPELYFHDGTHPSLAGDYLIALLFNRTLTHNSPENVQYIPQGLKPAEAHFMVKCASYGEP